METLPTDPRLRVPMQAVFVAEPQVAATRQAWSDAGWTCVGEAAARTYHPYARETDRVCFFAKPIDPWEWEVAVAADLVADEDLGAALWQAFREDLADRVQRACLRVCAPYREQFQATWGDLPDSLVFHYDWGDEAAGEDKGILQILATFPNGQQVDCSEILVSVPSPASRGVRALFSLLVSEYPLDAHQAWSLMGGAPHYRVVLPWEGVE